MEIQKFISICEKDHEIAKFYSFKDKPLEDFQDGTNNVFVNQLMSRLFMDLIVEINKTRIQKRRVYDLLCALHNLPRVYLGKNNETLCELMLEGILEQDAIEYAFNNMSLDMKEKYKQFQKWLATEKIRG